MPYDLDERYVQAAERALGVSLPTSYRLAIMRSNGGAVATDDDDWELYPIADDSDRKRLARTVNGVVPETKRARAWRGFPSAQFRWVVMAEVTSLFFSQANKGSVLQSSSGGMKRVSCCVSPTTSPTLWPTAHDGHKRSYQTRNIN